MLLSKAFLKLSFPPSIEKVELTDTGLDVSVGGVSILPNCLDLEVCRFQDLVPELRYCMKGIALFFHK